MKKLLNTLYVLSEDSYLTLENENIVSTRKDGSVSRIPLIGLESIYCFSYKGASPMLMGECVKRGIMLSFMTPNGKFLATTLGEFSGNVLLRREQYRRADSDESSHAIAQNMILGKLFNERWVLERTIRDHGVRIDTTRLENASEKIKMLLKEVPHSKDNADLRGLEGMAAATYFNVFNDMILNQKELFSVKNRNRRPPMDNTNAMLSFGYTMLANQCAAALRAVGLDPYVGFLHTDRPGRVSLALDLEEELRAPFVDRLVLTMINNRMIHDQHFEHQEDGTVLLNDEGRKLFLKNWQEKKRETITHPFLKEKVEWGMVPFIQAQLLARMLRHDIDAYPPFLWK